MEYNHNWIDVIKARNSKDSLLRKHMIELMRFFITIFKYENLPVTLESRFLELYLNTYGSVVIGKIDNDLYCVPPSLQGSIDAYNLGSVAFGVCPLGEIRGLRGQDVVWGINNKLSYPTEDVYFYADLFTQIDLSIKSIVINSRYHNIPIAPDNKSKVAIDKAMTDSEDGKPHTVLSSNLLSNDELDNGINILNLTDVKNSDRIQYIFHAKDDALRQLYNKYGQSAQGTSKMAQQTEKELQGGESWVVVNEMLECRQQMISEINRIFGTNITVGLSDAWKVDFELYTGDDASEDASEDTSEDASEDGNGGDDNG